MLRDRISLVSPRLISPFHEEIDPSHTARISASMKRNGWLGRPLVVMRLPDGTLKALTGSHRLRAAVSARVRVPVIELNEGEREAVISTLPWFETDRQELYSQEGDAPLTADIADPLYEIGSHALADLLRIEDFGFQRFTAKQIEELRDQDWNEEVIELLAQKT